jgi:hypothetical protein
LHYNIPEHRRAQHFIARHDIQEKLNETIHKQQSSGKTVVVSLIGMGGAGKTQVALEFCQSLQKISGVQKIFWIDALSSETVHSHMKNIVKLLNPSRQLEDENAAMKLVKEILSTCNDSWLMVLDNLDDPSKFTDILSLFPTSSISGTVLITSRHWALKRFSHVMLEKMNESDSFQLLLGHQPSEVELQPATQILEELGWLPLAIDQAQAYITKQDISLKQFIAKFHQRKKKILQTTPDSSVWQYKQKQNDTEDEKTLSVFTTWEMSLSLLKSSHRDNASLLEDILTILAFFYPNVIQESIFFCSIQANDLHRRHFKII